MKAQDYEAFRTKANPILGVSLPDQATLWRFGRVRGLGFRKVSGFISFAADWKPSFWRLKPPTLEAAPSKAEPSTRSDPFLKALVLNGSLRRFQL